MTDHVDFLLDKVSSHEELLKELFYIASSDGSVEYRFNEFVDARKVSSIDKFYHLFEEI